MGGNHSLSGFCGKEKILLLLMRIEHPLLKLPALSLSCTNCPITDYKETNTWENVGNRFKQVLLANLKL
jgi:hypothetical protein